MKVTIVRHPSGDWMGLYKDNELIDQNHSLYVPFILKELGIEVVEIESDFESHLPEKL